jgi:hypothetical protein
MTLWWLLLAIIAYSIFSLTGVVDKLVVSNKLKNPLTVSFWLGYGPLPGPSPFAFMRHPWTA